MEKDAENEVLELTQAIQNSRLRRRHILRKAVVEHSKLPNLQQNATNIRCSEGDRKESGLVLIGHRREDLRRSCPDRQNDHRAHNQIPCRVSRREQG